MVIFCIKNISVSAGAVIEIKRPVNNVYVMLHNVVTLNLTT